MLDAHLSEGLSVLAHAAGQMEACSVAVVVLEPGRPIRMVYWWPDGGANAGAASSAGSEIRAVLERLEEPVIADAAIARLLREAAASEARSFLLLPCPEQQCQVVIAFGYSSERPACCSAPKEVSAVVRLAALATWAVPEARRLRRDLHLINERLRHRKMVERAKGLLQVWHSWDEQQAYEHLRRLSRQRRKTLAETAQDLLRIPEGPDRAGTF